ncbi:antibiotic biosynthesis monooxygenase [Streptomyces sp. AV19]|uniref:antibiotic biosynthesis monooxygenase family protein n=1 Tax=Streptomyces sp. AV19 TaxID=2793068 RepID=UPI0018FEEE4C|nr:antibiotic biosynthesis monooxygenase family protein [Streptomyces sp. AV19]MBH1935799.1 antibiotic biosynthesis monooxygenase [Streptomyces sp. AV19]MDG4536101.1 antibiotic biosynthesis monooxygenase [Streptomyces sp. AV19]
MDKNADRGPVFRVMLRMDIAPGRERDFERTWERVARRIAAEPANLGQALARDVTESGVYHVVSDWTDEPAFREFERSEAHAGHRRRLRPFRLSGRMSVTRIVYELGGG